jgi:uncharacterized protein DUF6600/FecR-like protein
LKYRTTHRETAMRIAAYLPPALVPTLLLIIGLPGASIAQDPPDRVGRVSYVSGDVSFRPGDVDDWAGATVNYPLKGGDDLWADVGARAEIAIGSAAVRLAPSTAVGFLALDDQTTQLRLTQGSLQVRVRDLADDEIFEIATPNGAVSLLVPGSYRVDVDANGDETTVTVRDGRVELTAGGSTFTVDDGEAATVSGIDEPYYDVRDPLPPDPWEQWAANRDRRRDASLSARYVSSDLPGYEDLDEYGDWRETAEYGPVWTPRRVVAGWAPYRNGHWAWVDPWGWTWIDDASWGFAPYHYGRWVYLGRRWAWVPGRVRGRSVYAPALVAFVGGSNWRISVGVGGGVGWFPLGPNEVYVPTYRVSDRYLRNINHTTVNVTNITLADMANVRYRNRASPGAVTVVTREAFVGARPIGRSLIVVPRDRLNSAPVVGTAAPFAPTRVSVLNQSGRAARRPPANSVTRRVVVRADPPPPPVPFTVRERALQAHPGRPVDDATLSRLRGRTDSRETRFIRPAEGAGPALRPARRGLPEARPVAPATGEERRRQADAPDRGRGDENPPIDRGNRGRRPGQGDQPADRQDRGRRQGQDDQPTERRAPPTRDDRGRRADDPPYVPPLPTPPRLPPETPPPAEQPAPPREDRRRRRDGERPPSEPRPPVVPTPPEQQPPPPAEPPRQDRGRRPGGDRPQPEQRPPEPTPAPEPPKAAEPPAPPPRQDRGRRPDTGRPQPEPPPPVVPAPPDQSKAAVEINPITSVAISGPTWVHSNQICHWTATPTGGTGPYIYDWMSGNVVDTTSSPGTYSVHIREHFFVKVTVTSANGTQVSGSQEITVDEAGPDC